MALGGSVRIGHFCRLGFSWLETATQIGFVDHEVAGWMLLMSSRRSFDVDEVVLDITMSI